MSSVPPPLSSLPEEEKELEGPPSSSTRTILKKTVVLGGSGGGNDHDDGTRTTTKKELKLLFLGCEEGKEYGPYDHTATLFLELICRAIEEMKPTKEEGKEETTVFIVIITVYRVSQGDFPSEDDDFDYDSFDGIILPGSYDDAYNESKEWIQELKVLIQTHIVPFQRPTLGVCFGHQILAHSYGQANIGDGDSVGGPGRAMKCPAGKQVGRKSFKLTNAGRAIFGCRHSSNIGGDVSCKIAKQGTTEKKRKYEEVHDVDNKEEKKELEEEENVGDGTTTTRQDDTNDADNSIELYYTHGDMVESLPNCAVSLGGNDNVPIQGAAYFATPEDAHDFIISSKSSINSSSSSRPFAITLQAHPEYACDTSHKLGLQRTFGSIINGMESRKELSTTKKDVIMDDAIQHYDTVQSHSIQVMISIGRYLGWFP